MFGWAGKILHVDLEREIVTTIETLPYAERFIGGLGIAQKLYWDLAPPQCEAFDPHNPLVFMTGPLAATAAPSAPRLVVCGKSPCVYPEQFVSANIGGFFAPELKKAGYDGLVLTGRASAPRYLMISDSQVSLEPADQLWGQGNFRTRELLQDWHGSRARILSIGPAGENRTRLGVVFSDAGSAASMGFGSVMGAKNLKAVVVSGSGSIAVHDPQAIKRIRQRFRAMTGSGYFNLFGNPIVLPGTTVVKKVHCHGCPQGCWRTLQQGPDGSQDIRKCQLGVFYTMWDRRLHGAPTAAGFNAASIANDYGVCAMDLVFLLMWLDQCVQHHIIDAADTGLDCADMGSAQFLRDCIAQLCRREGFGAVMAEGALRASMQFGPASQAITEKMLTASGRAIAYGPKVFIPSAVIYATEPRPSITELHEVCEPLTKWALWYTSKGEKSYVSTDVLRGIARAFWGGEEAVDFSTYAGKAEMARQVQNRQYMKETLNLCDFAWPVYDDASGPPHVGDPTLEAQLFSAVTGVPMDLAAFTEAAERIITFNRMLLLREGRRGRADDTLPAFMFEERDEFIADVFGMHNPELYLPAHGDRVVSRKGKAVDRQGFARMMDDYYALRGWEATTGIPTAETLRRLQLDEMIAAG